MKKAPPWWQLPAIIGGCVVGVGAIGTGIVKTAKFLTITDRVEAEEQKNAEQDDALVDLKGIAKRLDGYIAGQQQMLQRQLPNQAALTPSPDRPGRFWDDQAQRWYCDDGWQTWWVNEDGNC